MVSKKSLDRDLTSADMFDASSIAFERDAQRVSRQFLRGLSGATEKRLSRK